MSRQQLKHLNCSVSHFVVLAIILSCTACTDTGRTGSDRKRAEWRVGYWYWQGWDRRDTGAIDREQVPIDLLYVHAGEYRAGNRSAKEDPVDMFWPEYLPKAEVYFAVFRCEGSGCTDKNIIPGLTGSYESLKRRIAKKSQRLVGLQIDYDCPTKELDRYGRFLADLRKALPKVDLLSITALLDWFSPGTRVADVMEE